MEVDQGLVMERSQEQLTNALLESSTELPLNILAIDSHPSDLILALLSQAVYTEKKPRETDADYGKRLELPEDWCLLATGSNPGWINGYFGAAYVHIKWQQVVVAHRGTVLSNAGSLITDAFGICWNQYTDCANTAITFADRIRQALHFVNTKHGRNYNLAITGHSLGGWLAQITSFTIKWLNVSGNFLMKNTSGGFHAKTVVFDSPGARAMLEKVREDHYDRLGYNFLERLDITVFVSAPNYVNTCGKHVGIVNRIIIDVSSFDWKVEWSNLIYTSKTHAISNFVEALKNNLNIINVTDWPKNRKELSKLFGKNALSLDNKYHENFDRKTYDLILSKQTIRYNTEKGIMAKCYLKSFSEDELQILYKLTSIQKQADVNWINKLILNKKLEKEKNDDVFPDFQINHNNLTISCESKQSLGKLTHRLKQLMRWLGQEFTEAVEEQFAALPRITDLFYHAEGQGFLDSLPKSSLNFTDSIGLKDFLLSDTARVLSIVTQDGILEMTRLQNLFSQLRENVLFSSQNEKYTLECHFTFLDWSRLQKLLKSGRSPIDQNNLLMVDGSLCTTFSLEHRKFLNNYKQSSPSVLKKLVFISSQPVEIFNSFENVKIFNVHRNMNLNDLSNDSQKAVLRRNIISTDKRAYTFAEFLGEDCSISEINEFLCLGFKKIVTNDDYIITIKDTRPRLSDQQMPIFETNIKTDKKFILKCVNSPNTLVVMSRKEVETLAGWEQLAGTEIILANGDAKKMFRETCNKNQQNSVYRLQVSNGDIYCKQIFNKNFYVSRKFFHRARIDVRKFAQTKHSNDLFVVHSIEDVTFLLELVSDCAEIEAFIGNVKVSDTKEREAELIQENLQKNLHFIKICQNEIGYEIEWRYSHGSVKSLQSYVSTESYDPIDEQTLSETERKMVIITDEPGMGKTTSLANLSRLVETPWVIYIELRNFQAHIRDRLPDGLILTPQNVASFLLSESCTSDDSLEHKFLLYLLQSKTSTKQVSLMFDGFDEVDDYIKNKESAKEKLVKLFNYLVNNPNVQLFLATRTYLKESLEEKLNQFSTSFEPIDGENQLNFLLMFWRSCLFLELGDYGEVEEGRLKEYVEEVLRQAKQVLGSDMSRFMGVPLQLRMLAEIFRPQSDLLIQSTEALLKNINIVSAPNLYKRFISLKYDIYIHDKTIIGEALSEDDINKKYLEPLSRDHGKLGFQLFFSEFYHKNFETIKDQELVNLNRLGLVQCKVNGEFQFVHRTYAEYCCAQIIVMWLDQQDIAFKYQLIKDIILPKVLLQPDSKVIRLFLNVELGEMKMSDTTVQSNAEQISRLWLEENAIFRNDDHQTALHIAVKEKNEHIITLLLSGLHYESTQEAFVSLITQYDNDNNTALHIMDQPTFHSKTEDDELLNKIVYLFFKSIVKCKEAVLLAYMFNRNISESYVSNYVLKSDDTSTEIKNIVSRLKYVQTLIIPFNEGLLKNKVNHTKTILFERLKNNIERYIVLLNGLKEHGTCLHFAAQNGHLGMVTLFAKQTSDLVNILLTRRDKNKKTSLLIATEAGNLDIVKLLVERGANINTRCKLGKTALIYAAFNRHTTICKYLIDSDAEIDAADNYGRTALYIASGKDNLSVVRYLIEGGAEKNSQDNDGWSALHIAVCNDNYSIVKYLIENSVKIDLKDKSGMSALHYATGNSNLSLVKYLIKSGAENNSLNNIGRTPLHIAAGNKNDQYITLSTILKNIVDSVRGKILRDRTARHYKVTGDVNQLIIKHLIESGTDINSVDNYGETALHIAKVNNNLSIIKYLTERGAEENDGRPALEVATGEDSNFSTVNNLIESGPEISLTDENYRTELHVAVSKNNLSAVKYFIEGGADFNFKDGKNHMTALHIAVSNNNLSLVKYILESGADITSKNIYGNTVLDIAVGNGYLSLVKYLIETGAEITSENNRGCTVLHIAVEKENLSLVKYLIEAGAKINSKDNRGRTGLHIAVEKDHLSLMKYLIETGAEINNKDKESRTILHMAVEKGNLSLVKYLIEGGAKINSKDNRGRTGLHIAVEKDHLSLMKYLIETGAEINNKDKESRTILHMAVEKDNLSLVKYLIEAGAKINSKNNRGRAVLHKAVEKGNLSLVKYLIEGGAKINSKDNRGRTGLHIAVEKDHLSLMKYLIETGAEINNKDKESRTILHMAVEKDNLSLVKYLIEAGVNINSVDYWGVTALYYAARWGHLPVLEYLLQQGADPNRVSRTWGRTALTEASYNEKWDAVRVLLKWVNTDVNADGGLALDRAIFWGEWSIVKCLIDKGALVQESLIKYNLSEFKKKFPNYQFKI